MKSLRISCQLFYTTPGKRGTLPQGCTSQGDHPRACGEKSGDCLWNIAKKGSPPRVRGKGKGGKEKVCILRITPARAGKSPLPARGNSCLGDHPRACGEKIREQLRKLNAQGSPPRVRGKDTGAAAKAQRTGITPAHAGKSLGRAVLPGCLGDHPRTRGEKKWCFQSSA